MNNFHSGYIQKRRVKCGKPNCKCASGEMHTAYYHVWYSEGVRYQKYIRQSKVEQVRQACQNNRDLQIKLRLGRLENKHFFARARAILRMIKNEK